MPAENPESDRDEHMKNVEQIIIEKIWDEIEPVNYEECALWEAPDAWKDVCKIIYKHWGVGEYAGRQLTQLVPERFFDMSNRLQAEIFHHWTNRIYFERSDPRINSDEMTYFDDKLFNFHVAWLLDFAYEHDMQTSIDWMKIRDLVEFVGSELCCRYQKPNDAELIAYHCLDDDSSDSSI